MGIGVRARSQKRLSCRYVAGADRIAKIGREQQQ
jgi:hypothetical protein